MPDFSYRTWLRTWRKAGSPRFPKRRWLMLVLWTDAASAERPEDARTVQGSTGGWLLDADENAVQIGLTTYGDDDSRDVITIPASTVTYILEILELPA